LNEAGNWRTALWAEMRLELRAIIVPRVRRYPEEPSIRRLSRREQIATLTSNHGPDKDYPVWVKLPDSSNSPSYLEEMLAVPCLEVTFSIANASRASTRRILAQILKSL